MRYSLRPACKPAFSCTWAEPISTRCPTRPTTRTRCSIRARCARCRA